MPSAYAERLCAQAVHESEFRGIAAKKGLGPKFILKYILKPTLSFGFGMMVGKEPCSLTLCPPTVCFNPFSDMWALSTRSLSLQNHLHKGTQVGNGHQGNSSCSFRAT